MRIRSISGRANAMFTGRHDDRSERCKWALGLLRAMIMIVLDRKMDDLIRTAGFQVYALEIRCMKGPKPWTFMYRGSATI